MTDPNMSQPPAPGAWYPPAQPGPAGPVPPPPPSTFGASQTPPQHAWAPPPPPPGAPPTATFNPTPVGRSGAGYYRRRTLRGNGIYSMVVGIISILVPVVSLLVMGNGHFTFLSILPIAGLVYGIMSVVQGNRRGFGIAGIVLCAAALLLELFLVI